MTKRRSRGDGGLHWDPERKRWVATVTLGYDGRGKRIVKKSYGRTKTEAKDKLRETLRDLEDGLTTAPGNITVADAVRDWLAFGLADTSEATQTNYETLCRIHIVPELGRYKLRDLRAAHVDKWLATKSTKLSTRTLRLTHSLLNRAVNHAMARDLVKRNVVALVKVPPGRRGRPSRSLTLEQAKAILDHAEGHTFYAYVVLSLLTGARTEELRALTWSHTHLEGDSMRTPPLPPYIEVWQSVRAGNDTKTRRSRRSLALPARCVEALNRHKAEQFDLRRRSGASWLDLDLVFCSEVGGELDATAARWRFRQALQRVPGLDPWLWTPRELRHSFVSILSDQGVPLEDISQLVGHSSTVVTETVYRHQLRPVIEQGARSMDSIFGDDPPRAAPHSDDDVPD